MSPARLLVEALAAAVPRFSPQDRQEKLRLLERLAACPIRRPGLLSRLHEALCFLQAHPDDAEVLARADRALEVFPSRVKRLAPAAADRLRDSGIAGTRLDYPFGFPMARWLASRFPRDAEIAWERFEEGDRLQETLPLLVTRAEDDALSDEGGLGWRRWLRVAKGGRRLTDLQLLVELFEGAGLEEQTRDWLFEGLGLDIRWTLNGPGASRTLAKLPWPRPFFPDAAGEAAPAGRGAREFLAEVKRPLGPLRRAPRPLAEVLIEAARAGVATRLRELFAFVHANPDDVLVADPGWGLRIALIGLLPRCRLAYHGYYAYLALKNGVPVGYGGGWQLFGTLEAGVNIFETFRGGESGFLVGQILRAYRQALGMRRVVIDPYQIGRDNPEALRSGSFYFYYHRGFRPRDPGVRRLAEEEQAKIARDRSYRSPLPVLKQLASSEMLLSLDGGEPESARGLGASRLAALVTDHIARRFQGDRQAAAREASDRVARVLGVRGWTGWTREERQGFEPWSLVVSLIPDLARWPAADRRRLAQALRARGGASEARYVRLLDGHARLRRSLAALAGSPGGDGPARHPHRSFARSAG